MSKHRKKGNGKGHQSGAPIHDPFGPTPERISKEPFGWDKFQHAGGQNSYRNKTVLDFVRDHLPEKDHEALTEFADLAETALRNNVICGRAYTGMPYTGGGDNAGHVSEAQSDAMAELKGSMEEMWKVGEIYVTTALALVLALKKDPDAKPMTLEEFGATLMRWRDGPTNKGGGLVALRYTAPLIRWARLRFASGERGRDRALASAQSAFEHGKVVGARELQEAIAKRERLRSEVESHFKGSGGATGPMSDAARGRVAGRRQTA
jgi:hypothetical protein